MTKVPVSRLPPEDGRSVPHQTDKFWSCYRHGFVRVAAGVTPIALADPEANVRALARLARSCSEQGAGLVVFPELSLSGYALDDLHHQDALLDAVESAAMALAEVTAGLLPVIVVGAPLRCRGRLFNTALVIHRGQILGVVPKSYLPNYREFYERRYFAAGDDVRDTTITIAGKAVPFGTDLLFEAEDLDSFVLHVEICEDYWLPVPPSSLAALAGATVLANLSGSPITVGRADSRRLLAQSQSARCLAAYLYAAAGPGESTTDLSWDGQVMVFENGVLLEEAPRFPVSDSVAIADVDLDRLRQERIRMGSFEDNRRHFEAAIGQFRRIAFRLDPPVGDIGFRRRVERYPFVPSDKARLTQDCFEAYNIQVSGLAQRLRATGVKHPVIGVSGGLDSTQALIIAARTMDLLGLPRANILAYTMPGFATSDVTKTNALALMQALGVSSHEIDIRPAARTLLADLDHPFARGEAIYDVTFENVQAGLRTDYLFRLANQRNGMVIGTGDLSELALGWCTYGVGDQMSHYAVNSGVPKTLIQHLIRWAIQTHQFGQSVEPCLEAILQTEISPELVPVEAGQPIQSTEEMVGPFALQDFSLYHVLRYGFRPSKIAFLAYHAWGDAAAGEWPAGFPEKSKRSYSLAEISHWMELFLRRFFAGSQFKRSAIPNGPKVVAGGSLSPRGDWRAPSDGNARVWLEELRTGVPDGREPR
ncbi:NAD(+) synthase [Telmatospirillum sp.]|uniref:NAD(+) synthase n=1 Tax=Telmatospirillum sp. TaxID=2079197 RepID=UPI002843D972|nr:NAD(+) synthase [Telmatospirillum sp.]MDR3439312.1 NAD(+) synthase [Telmatospirillum sp.]